MDGIGHLSKDYFSEEAIARRKEKIRKFLESRKEKIGNRLVQIPVIGERGFKIHIEIKEGRSIEDLTSDPEAMKNLERSCRQLIREINIEKQIARGLPIPKIITPKN